MLRTTRGGGLVGSDICVTRPVLPQQPERERDDRRQHEQQADSEQRRGHPPSGEEQRREERPEWDGRLHERAQQAEDAAAQRRIERTSR